MPRILLTRHGHVEGISPERFRGRADIPLTETGLAQAGALANRIADESRPAAIYASPLRRCMATGEAISTVTGALLHAMESLLDIDYGAWQCRTFDVVREHWPALFGLWRSTPHLVRFPEGESLQDLFARAADAIRFVLELYDDETVVLIGHDSVNKAILLQILDQPPSAYWKLVQGPCALNELHVTRDHARVLSINDASHLRSNRECTEGQGFVSLKPMIFSRGV
jgi:probable phosphoglycerate mutase